MTNYNAPASCTPDRECCEEETCWICLAGSDETSPELGKLLQPCGCTTRWVHTGCLARWQLQSAGKKEEHNCRFCFQQYSTSYADCLLPQQVREVQATPVMAVVYGNQVFKIPVKPGPEGEAEFKARVKTLFGFPHDMDFDVTFEVKIPQVPGSQALPGSQESDKLLMKGLQCFGAAATCAAASAAARAMARNSSNGSQPEQRQSA